MEDKCRATENVNIVGALGNKNATDARGRGPNSRDRGRLIAAVITDTTLMARLIMSVVKQAGWFVHSAQDPDCTASADPVRGQDGYTGINEQP